jgi:hypothetical protein
LKRPSKPTKTLPPKSKVTILVIGLSDAKKTLMSCLKTADKKEVVV